MLGSRVAAVGTLELSLFRTPLHLALAACLWAGLAAACANGSATSTAAGSSASGSGAAANVDPKLLVLRTDPGSGEVRAGMQAKVQCRAFLPPVKGAAADQTGAEVALPGPATLAVVAGPAGPLAIKDGQLILGKVGEYKVQCQVPSLGLLDATPPTLYVIAGLPTALDTLWVGLHGQPPTPQPAQVTAGSLVQCACSAHDAYGNAIVSGFSLQVAPDQGTAPGGLVAPALKAGSLQLACEVDGTADKTPLTLQVAADVPRHLFTLLEPAQIVAGNASQLTCAANDAWGNPIADFPFALDLPKTVTVKGLYATSTKAGAHKLQCVPETLDWSLFTLHPAVLTVEPGPPSQLEVLAVPNKPVYKQEEKVTFVSAVKDAFDNLVPTATVDLAVLAPAKGWKVIGGNSTVFAEDGKYQLQFTVQDHPKLVHDRTLIVDGTPPLLTIDYPPWGATLQGKASVQVKGTAGDATSGIKTLQLNGKNAYVSHKSCQTDQECTAGVCNPETYTCSIGTWVNQYPAKHGLNRLEAKTTDIGDQSARATRGFYYSGSYYPVDGTQPDAALVPDGMQVFLGHDFFDDGDHDPKKPNDLATLMEIALAGLDVATLLPPGGLNSGGVEVTLSNFKFDKPTVSLQTVDGGLDLALKITNIKTDIAVKAKQKVGPISVTIKVTGDIKIGKLLVNAGMGMAVFNGFVEAKVTKSQAAIEDMKLHVDGIAGLFDFLFNMILDAYEGQIADQIVAELNKQIPKLIGGLLSQMAINAPIPLPAAVKGGKDVTIQLVSKLKTLKFSPKGGLVLMDAGFSAAKGTAHVILGSIARSGCIGTVEDAFAIDQTKRLQFAMHDDVINQLLHAVWYAGGLKLDKVDLAALGGGGGGSGSPVPLDGATLDLDLFLPPILESCGGSDPMKFRIQVGDASIGATVPMGDPPLKFGFFGSFDIGAGIALGKDAQGNPQVSVQVDKQLLYHLEMVSITKEFEAQKPFFEQMITKLLSDQLDKGLPGLDKIDVALPSLDIGGVLPGMPAGSKIGLAVTKLFRASGFSVLDAELQ